MTDKNKVLKWRFKCQGDREDYIEEGYFIGTEDEFKEMKLSYQNLWGYGFWDITTSEPTKSELEEYCSTLQSL